MTIFGCDISSYQAGLDLARLADSAFVIAKTTEGTYYIDDCYQGWRQQAAVLKKMFCWYHFLSGEDVRAQVGHCLANVGDKTLPGMLDVEPTGNYTPTLQQALAWIDAAHAAGLNLRLAYIPRWLHQQWDSPSLAGLTSRNVYLVSSSYPGGTGSAPALYPGDSAAGWRSYGGMTPLIYQYTNQASDGGQDLDYNAFRGTANELANLLNGNQDMPLTQADADLLVNAMLAKLPAATATAVNKYNEGPLTVDGKPYAASLFDLVRGAWKATNDPGGGVEQMRGQVNNLFHRAAYDPAGFAAAVTPVIQKAVAAGLPADQVAAKIAALVPEHLTLTVGVK